MTADAVRTLVWRLRDRDYRDEWPQEGDEVRVHGRQGRVLDPPLIIRVGESDVAAWARALQLAQPDMTTVEAEETVVSLLMMAVADLSVGEAWAGGTLSIGHHGLGFAVDGSATTDSGLHWRMSGGA